MMRSFEEVLGLDSSSESGVHRSVLSPLGYSVGYLRQLGVPGAPPAAVVPAAAARGCAAQLGGGGCDGGDCVELGLAGGPRGRRVGRPQRPRWAVHFA